MSENNNEEINQAITEDTVAQIMTPVDKIKQKATDLATVFKQKSATIMIVDGAMLERAGNIAKQIKENIKAITAGMKPHKDNAYKTWKDLCVTENESIAPFQEAMDLIKPKIIAYQDEQQAIADEKQRQDEADQRQWDADEKKKLEDEKIAEAVKLEASGDYEKAAEVLEAPIEDPTPIYVPPPLKQKAAGAGISKKWKARMVDFSKVEDRFKTFDQKAANQFATALKKNAKAPGIEFYPESHLSGK